MAAASARRLQGGYRCPRCDRHVDERNLSSGPQVCGLCSKSYEFIRYDPPSPRAAVAEVAGTGPQEDPPCARHERNKAEAACARCGQFMCGLCRIDSGGQIYCPGCFERLSAEGTLPGAVNRSPNYAGIGLLCALSCLMLSWTIIAPLCAWIVGIVFCVKGLKDKKARGDSEGRAGLVIIILVNLLMGLFSIMIALAILGVMG